MEKNAGFTDLHAHFLPGLDDGAASWDESLDMARIAVNDGVQTVVVTPHQLGAYRSTHGDTIRSRTREFQQRLQQAGIGLSVLPGADVRIEPDLVQRLESGAVLTLGDRGDYVLLELPHELYFPLDSVLTQLKRAGYRAILSHPERNQGILANPSVVEPLVRSGCLMQVTAGSLLGSFGTASRCLAESLVKEGLIHVVATDAHGSRRRRPLMSHAFQQVAKLTSLATAVDLCRLNPFTILAGGTINQLRPRAKRGWRWLGLARSA